MNTGIKDTQEVYMVTGENTVCYYVGSGKLGRHKHCLSGVSHVYELNKLHFLSKEDLTVKVVATFATKEEAMQKELELIRHYNPLFNKVHNSKDPRTESCQFGLKLRAYLFNYLNDWRKNFTNAQEQSIGQVIKHLEDILEKYTVQDMVRGVILPKQLCSKLMLSERGVTRTKASVLVNEILENKQDVLSFSKQALEMKLPLGTFVSVAPSKWKFDKSGEYYENDKPRQNPERLSDAERKKLLTKQRRKARWWVKV